jgi:hypothetical protein
MAFPFLKDLCCPLADVKTPMATPFAGLRKGAS